MERKVYSVREKLTILGHSHEVECAPDDVVRVRRLALLLEERMRSYVGGEAVENMTKFTEALLVTGLQMEKMLSFLEGEEEKDRYWEDKAELAEKSLEDKEGERDSVQDKYDELVGRGNDVWKRVRFLEEGLGRLYRRMEEDRERKGEGD